MWCLWLVYPGHKLLEWYFFTLFIGSLFIDFGVTFDWESWALADNVSEVIADIGKDIFIMRVWCLLSVLYHDFMSKIYYGIYDQIVFVVFVSKIES